MEDRLGWRGPSGHLAMDCQRTEFPHLLQGRVLLGAALNRPAPYRWTGKSGPCFWNSSLENYKKGEKNLNCVDLLYLLLFFLKKKDKLVNRVI